ncbi:hypothetical protein Tco_1448892 [Tanacetum coccineum]
MVHTGGLILQLMDELVKETKIESMEPVTIKTLWANTPFDYALSSYLGNSGGILCVWEPTLFVKDNVTKSDNFLAIMGLHPLSHRSMRWRLYDYEAIEGDENTKFFHGILNSKHSQLAIRGTLVDGEWIVDPLAVKSVFLKYFSTQFSSPVSLSICFANQFTNRHKKFKAMVFKVDFEKAFEYIRWDYLQDILKMFGFGDKWCGWINGCLNSAIRLILVNGSPTSEFHFTRV